MKIKQVEISAFRIYNDPENATFRFTGQGGQTSDFVALYAPNGFGKTSFYDAVEWGITNSINRFYIRNKELGKLADNQYQKNDFPLIQHNKSKLPTSVKITPEKGKMIEKSLPKTRKGKHDINFNTPVVHDFQQVILSQEWISAFLTQSDGEERFKKFMEKPDLAETYAYYNTIKIQIGILEVKKIETLKAINELGSNLDEEESEDLLQNVNEQIKVLKIQFKLQGFQSITLDSTKQDIKKLRDLIVIQRSDAERQRNSSIRYQDISAARHGTPELLSLSQYFASKAELAEKRANSENIRSIRETFKTIPQGLNALNRLNDRLADLTKKLEEAERIISMFSEYSRVHLSLGKKNKEKEKLNALVVQLTAKINKQKNSENDVLYERQKAEERLANLKSKLSQIPVIKKDLRFLNAELKKLDKQVLANRITRQTMQKEIDLHETNIESWNSVIEYVQNETGKSSFAVKDRPISAYLAALRKVKSEKGILEQSIAELDFELKRNNEFASNIGQLIESGIAIASDLQSSSCPLCEHSYESFSALAAAIGNNKFMQDSALQLLLQKTKLQARVTGTIAKQKQVVAKIITACQARVARLEDLRNALLDRLTLLNEKELFEFSQIKGLNAQISQHQQEFEGNQSSEQYERSLKAQIVKAAYSLKLQTEKSSSQSVLTQSLEKELGLLHPQLELLANDIERLSKNAEYLAVIGWFQLNFPGKKILLIQLQSFKRGLLGNISKTEKARLKTTEILKTQNDRVASYTIESIDKESNQLQRSIKSLLKSVSLYENFLASAISIKVGKLFEKELDEKLEAKQQQYLAKDQEIADLLTVFEKLDKFSENLVGFLQSANAKIKRLNLIDEFEFLKNEVSVVLQTEKAKAKDHLAKKIKDFFYEDLINELYRKIDPHPNFKKVHFDANLDLDQPRLDVFVRNETNDEFLIPNLYFSTAQINVLSLSIFLAAALNSEKYDCIFIDDPIQSMDSINILSTVDLLRSIIVNHKKQIILSTHDGVFFKLLQKKIPSAIYNSTFLELESFGKLKGAS